MFNEREALRLRLEQLNDAEINVMRELREERNEIYSKLRELDNSEPNMIHKKPLLELANATAKPFEKNKPEKSAPIDSSSIPRRKPKPGTKAYKHREAALKILKRHKGEIKSRELQKEIEKETGMSIPNMTTFMQGLIKFHPEVEKTYRGQYVLRKEKGNAVDESPS
ncbi:MULTISPECIES: Rok-like winged helix domain-containing protein [Bacillus]|uniref:Rok-like winged helix domain-containing protein n=1 Tax=Bacillus TaxID=1386 RepID=UPI00158141DC|nr:transcriptional repressor Rok [Bacillus glycinifermentans]MBU8785250.1 transcriptional repressor Rok [Bacillus glycinifermentans]NUJ15420.1 transcriptional repressor Rok [Bacillus glycinifermentans]